MRNKLFFLALVCVFLITLVTANGMKVFPNPVIMNKSVGTDETIVLTISNEDSITFSNISFAKYISGTSELTNDYISFPTIASLLSGANITVTAIVKSNININKVINIQGFFNSSVGPQTKQWDVNLTRNGYNVEMSPCNFNVIVGDTIVWENTVYDQTDFKMKVVSGTIPESDAIILINQSFQKTFTDSGTFVYQFYVSSIDVSGVCSITVRNTNELVNDATLDALLNLQVNVNYKPTTITNVLSVYTTTVKPFQKTEIAIMTLTNNGNEVAHNIILSGNWFTFSKNNIDLEPNVSTSVIIYVEPIVSSTSDTDKIYNIVLTIDGNFPLLSNNFSLFVQYQAIGSLNGTTTEQLDSLLRGFCERNPEVCRPIQIIQGNNGTSGIVQVNITQEQFRDIWIHMFASDEARQTLDNYIKENIDLLKTDVRTTTGTVQQLNQTLTDLQENQSSSMQGVIVFIIIVVLVIVIFLIGMLIYLRRRRVAMEALRRY